MIELKKSLVEVSKELYWLFDMNLLDLVMIGRKILDWKEILLYPNL